MKRGAPPSVPVVADPHVLRKLAPYCGNARIHVVFTPGNPPSYTVTAPVSNDQSETRSGATLELATDELAHVLKATNGRAIVTAAGVASIQDLMGLSGVIIARVCDMVKRAVPPHIAFRTAGVKDTQWRKWMELGQRGVDPFASAYESVMQANAQAHSDLVTHLSNQAQFDWKSAHTLLKAMDPSTYGDKKTISMKVEGVDVGSMKKSELRAYAHSLLASIDTMEDD